MGDPRGPWQDYGQDDDTGEIAPRHLVDAPGPPPTQGFGADHRPAHTRAAYRNDDDDAARPWTFREAVDRAAWRYRTAPLWAKVSTDVAAASLVVLVLVGVALLLRPDHSPQLAAANGTSIPTVTTTTVPPTTTTSTTIPPTTTTVATTTTTTARPVAPPPTQPPPPPTEAPTTTAAVQYESCRDAFFAGALPLFAGDPGYGPHLDRDGDGEACEYDERNRG
jgi:hypothetical protein